MSQVLDPIYAPIELEIDVAERRARLRVPGLVESDGSPIMNPHTGAAHHAQIQLPNGFEYTVAEVGKGSSRVRAGIELTLDTSGSRPMVIGHVSRARGRRVIESEQPIAEVDVGDLTDQHVLEFVMRELPPEVQPGDVLTALAAVSARLLATLRPEDREPAYEYLMTTVRAHSGLPAIQ